MHDLKDLVVPDSELEVSLADSSQPPPDSRLAPLIERTRARLATAESTQALFDEVFIQFISTAERNSALNELSQRTHKLRAVFRALAEYAPYPRLDETCFAESVLPEQTILPQKPPADRLSELDAQLCEIERGNGSNEDAFNSHKALFASCVSTIGKDKFIGIS